MNRRRAISLLGGAAVAWPLVARAQQSVLPVVGFLYPGTATSAAHIFGAFVAGLRELSYVEGQNFQIAARWSDGDDQKLAGLAADLVRLPADVIVAGTTPAVHAAQQATGTIPIVMANVADPVRLGFVASLAHPGRNITGVSNQVADLGSKQLQLLKEVVPTVRRVNALINPHNAAHLRWKDYQAPASELGMSFDAVEALSNDSTDGVEDALAALERNLPDALMIFGDGIFQNRREYIAQWARAARLPTMHVFRDGVEAGGLMSYGPDQLATYRRAAMFVSRILKGTKPSDLPVEQPTRFYLVINIKTANALGLTIPNAIQLLADEVIE